MTSLHPGTDFYRLAALVYRLAVKLSAERLESGVETSSRSYVHKKINKYISVVA